MWGCIRYSLWHAWTLGGSTTNHLWSPHFLYLTPLLKPLQMLSASSVLASAPVIATSSTGALTYFQQGQPGSGFRLPVSAALHHGHPTDLRCGGCRAVHIAHLHTWPWRVWGLPHRVDLLMETGPRRNPSVFLHSPVLWALIRLLRGLSLHPWTLEVPLNLVSSGTWLWLDSHSSFCWFSSPSRPHSVRCLLLPYNDKEAVFP